MSSTTSIRIRTTAYCKRKCVCVSVKVRKILWKGPLFVKKKCINLPVWKCLNFCSILRNIRLAQPRGQKVQQQQPRAGSPRRMWRGRCRHSNLPVRDQSLWWPYWCHWWRSLYTGWGGWWSSWCKQKGQRPPCQTGETNTKTKQLILSENKFSNVFEHSIKH